MKKNVHAITVSVVCILLSILFNEFEIVLTGGFAWLLVYLLAMLLPFFVLLIYLALFGGEWVLCSKGIINIVKEQWNNRK